MGRYGKKEKGNMRKGKEEIEGSYSPPS